MQAELESERSKSEATWELVFEDTFDRDKIGPNWTVVGGLFRIVNGELEVDGGGGDARLFCRIPVCNNVRMEFEGYVTKRAGYNGEVACFILSTFAKLGETDGYFGSISAVDEKLWRADTKLMVGEKLLEYGHKYKICLEKRDEIVRFYVNGVLSLEYRDYFPIGGKDQGSSGLYAWNSISGKL
jgi:hypothetical protein